MKEGPKKTKARREVATSAHAGKAGAPLPARPRDEMRLDLVVGVVGGEDGARADRGGVGREEPVARFSCFGLKIATPLPAPPAQRVVRQAAVGSTLGDEAGLRLRLRPQAVIDGRGVKLNGAGRRLAQAGRNAQHGERIRTAGHGEENAKRVAVRQPRQGRAKVLGRTGLEDLRQPQREFFFSAASLRDTLALMSG